MSSQEATFGYPAMRLANVRPSTAWQRMIERHSSELELEERRCRASTAGECNLDDWKALIERVRGGAPAAQLAAVNAEINRAPYIADETNYGVADYWATPRQTMKNGGDCEDYAIAKYLALRALGWAAEDLRIVSLLDLNLRVLHAVLVVNYGSRTYVLDNLNRAIVIDDRIRHYRPIYSLNERNIWLYRGRD